ncbi:phospholipase D/nuclease [Tilletiopsis washingtonensis]|uniref:Phospholipase n=1 Tax=Tilletiopsis washingtonensis TaxID=58919 RepID=A0A316Z739_9BASI|nr:phospholipase D/nuclease [Tilletiopsis washingtonensis]PWN96045.1 phospholipase D/nuclease [Tilletiopsis washingtonensis]
MGVGDTILKHLKDPSKIGQSMERLAVSVSNTVNPNHRHDEEHEKAADAQRQAICDSHRFQSFARVRQNNAAKWYSSGHDYFWALSELLESAEETIFILDWWLTPELYLRRPSHLHEDFRLDRILKRKAEQGVAIRIVVYKEVTETMTMSSAHTKHYLEDLHPNIQVFRSPDHLGGEITLFYSHHEKLVCVDNAKACIGGLDICFGRWDTQLHPLSDCHPSDILGRTLFVGQDYNNARVEDFQQVDNWAANKHSSLVMGRMPWQDVHVMLHGVAALDVAQHFIERWCFLKELKYKRDKTYSLISFPNGAENLDDVDEDDDAVARHPFTTRFHSIGEHFKHPWHRERRALQGPEGEEGGGTVDIQVLRSSADWSTGILTEHSILNAYQQLITEAVHCIYIENQFFITTTEADARVSNTIGASIAARIIMAARAGKRFKVVIVIPTIPCFAGTLDAAAGIRTIMNFQYKSISRGPHSIMEVVRAAGYDPAEYISFYNLRSFDRLPLASARQAEENSGISYHAAQVAAARVYLGEEGAAKQRIAIKVPATPESMLDKDGKTKTVAVEEVDMPASIEEAEDIIRRYGEGVPEESLDVRDSVASCFLHGQPDLREEPWNGTEEEEKRAFVTEECYVHSKCMIIDDRKVLIGSANINDRSQMGNRDSEIACVLEDRDLFESTMNGEKYMAGRFVASFRRHLFRQHLGLVSPQECTPESGEPTDAMRPAPHPNPDPEAMAQEEEWEALVADPLSEELEQMWKGQARTNTAVADDLFQVVPSDRVRDWPQYDDFFVCRGPDTGHIAHQADKSIDEIKHRLSEVRGHLIEMPLLFMDQAKDFERTDLSTSKQLLDLYI